LLADGSEQVGNGSENADGRKSSCHFPMTFPRARPASCAAAKTN
jgi:hypothetical protein